MLLLILPYLFSFPRGKVRSGRLVDLLLECLEQVDHLRVVRMPMRHLDVRFPVLALVTPVARIGSREPVNVVNEPLRREQRLALNTLYARRELLGVQFGHAHAPGLAEHIVEHLERERDDVVGHRGRGWRDPVEQCEAQPLGIRLGHQSA